MRFLVGLSAVLLVAACSGASSSELFAGEPAVVIDADAATEPVDERPDDRVDASTDEDVTTTKDATTTTTKDASPKDAAKEAAAEECFLDTECKSGDFCNWKTDQCAPPGPLGAPCKRDLECTDKLCNWKLEACSDPAPVGTACRRNKECASGACGGSSICK